MVNAGSPSPPAKNRCRQIASSDFDAVVGLLTRGFPVSSESYWRHVLARLDAHPTPDGFPKYGYLLESDGAIVGVILQIFVALETVDGPATRCYMSSWYVEPAFRGYASPLVSTAIRRKDVTYVNVSPDPRTWSIIEAQGFSRYSNGQYRAVPALSLRSDAARVREVPPRNYVSSRGTEPAATLLADHAGYGCLSLVCETSTGEYPFVFQIQRIGRGFVPCAQLIYCRDIADLVRFARPLGLFLLRRGIPCVSVDASEPVAGLIGLYFNRRSPKYYRGPHAPRTGDLAYTEAVLFEPQAKTRDSSSLSRRSLAAPCANDQ
jgi:hypothetical protein